MTAGFILPILHLRPVLHIAWECLQQMKILIFLIRNPGQKNVIRFFVQMSPEESMDRGIIPLLKTKEGNPIMVYHARTEAEIEGNPLYNPNRHAMLMKIRWDEKNRRTDIFLRRLTII